MRREGGNLHKPQVGVRVPAHLLTPFTRSLPHLLIAAVVQDARPWASRSVGEQEST